jgi:hypothetical protein
MRPSVLLILSLLLAGPARGADDDAKPAAPSGDEIASFALKGFDLASVKTFDFARTSVPASWISRWAWVL